MYMHFPVSNKVPTQNVPYNTLDAPKSLIIINCMAFTLCTILLPISSLPSTHSPPPPPPPPPPSSAADGTDNTSDNICSQPLSGFEGSGDPKEDPVVPIISKNAYIWWLAVSSCVCGGGGGGGVKEGIEDPSDPFIDLQYQMLAPDGWLCV